MPVNWIDTTTLSYSSLFLLERVQISWLKGYTRPRHDLRQSADGDEHELWAGVFRTLRLAFDAVQGLVVYLCFQLSLLRGLRQER